MRMPGRQGMNYVGREGREECDATAQDSLSVVTEKEERPTQGRGSW